MMLLVGGYRCVGGGLEKRLCSGVCVLDGDTDAGEGADMLMAIFLLSKMAVRQ